MTTSTKTVLLDAAEKIARARGFDGFSYADLASAVGIRKASIHHHFPTKAGLSVALIQRYHNVIEAECAAINVKEKTGSTRLEALIFHYRDALDDGKSLCLCVSFSTSRESLPVEVVSHIQAFRAMVIDWLNLTFETGRADGSIRNVVEPMMEASATLPLLEGAQLTARTEENPVLFDTALALLRKRLN